LGWSKRTESASEAKGRPAMLVSPSRESAYFSYAPNRLAFRSFWTREAFRISNGGVEEFTLWTQTCRIPPKHLLTRQVAPIKLDRWILT
jgi:hypothetical protein